MRRPTADRMTDARAPRLAGGYGCVPVPCEAKGTEAPMPDANIRIPAESRDRLASIAAAEGLSLRAYLARLADTLLTPEERAVRAEEARAALRAWNGYNPTEAQQADIDAELDRRMSQVAGP